MNAVSRVLAGASLVAALTAGCAQSPPRTDADKLARLSEMIEDVASRFPDVQNVTVAEVGRLLEKDSVVLVDVREPREREVSMIPGAISAEAFERDPSRYADVAVVAYCTIGHRSSEYARRLTAAGHPVANLSGSILAWAHAGGPLVTGGPLDAGDSVAAGTPTTRIHVYGRQWDLAPARYETIW